MRTKVNNKIVAMLWLVFVMSAVFVSELTLTVSAQDTADLPSRSVYTGTDDNSCKWSYDTTTRVLTVESNDSDAKTLHSLTGSNIDVVKANASRLVLKKIDTVMPSVFKGYKFSTIEFCPELRWIRDNAFESLLSLNGIDLSGTTLFWIEPSAFKGCTNLKSAVFPDTLRQINESAFEGCTALREVDLSNTGVYIIDDSAFKECTFLGKMLFPDTLETLGDYAIYKCGSISDSNTEIASRLKELDLRMVKKFGDHAVSENRWLTTISISKKIDEIGGSVTSTTFVGNGRAISSANGYWDTYFYGTEDLFNSIPNLKDNPFPKAVTYTEYPLWVGGTQVTIENCNDIPAAAPGNRTGKASYDPFKNTLTLDGYKYTGPGAGSVNAGIYSNLADELTIELIGENEVIVEETTNAGNHDGIYSENDLVIEGSGSLDVEPGEGSGNSICYGICFSKELTIGGDCTVNATAPSGPKVSQSTAIRGFNPDSHLTIKDRCTVNAAGVDTSGTDNTYSYGIDVINGIEITGGKIVAIGGKAQYSYGLSYTTTIAPADNSAIEVEASGETQAIGGNVVNTIGGAGWMNTDGAGDAAAIAASNSGQTLNYKKVRFPAYMINVTADPEEGGTVTGGGTYDKGETVTLKAEADTAAGYKFVNWTENGEEVKDESGQAVGDTYIFDATKDRDLKANFRIPLTITAKDQTFTVTFVDGQGSTLKTETVESGKAATAPADPTRDGYTFDGWDKDFSKVTSDLTVTAKWEEKTAPEPEPQPEPAPEPVAPVKVSGTLMARMTAKGSNSLVLTWNKIKGAEGYDVFFVKCGKTTRCKKVRTIKAGKKLTWTKKGLKKKRAYKAYVKAWVMKDGKKTYVRKSPTVHAYTSGSKDRYTVAKSITIKSKKEVTLAVGKTYKIKAKINKLDESKELMTVFHAPKLRYKSTNTKVATVSKSGKIKARGKGTCKIYVFAANGVKKTVKVTVN